MIPASVLDLTPVPSGSTGADALRNTIDLARHADRLGFSRYWLAEHHNTPGMACPAPEVMIGYVASATQRIRVGSGGVMLPNHSSLRVAETFRLLESLHPGRIDLGIGRAPGTDGVTAFALRRGMNADEFPSQLAELLAFAEGAFPDDHPYRAVSAEPHDAPLPPVWILGSGDYGAKVAAAMGVGFAFARHLNPRGAAEAIRIYREGFTPSGRLPAPCAIVATSVVAADTTERAEELAWSLALGVIRLRQGRPTPLPSPEEAMAHTYTADEEDQVRRYRRSLVLGTGDEVCEQVGAIMAETGGDEFMAMTTIHDHRERVRSHEILADALGLSGERTPTGRRSGAVA